MELKNNKILITGGGSGIGLGLTERFLQEGNKVIICGRREEVLKAIADKHPGLITHVCDLASEADREKLHRWIVTEHNDLNVLVNNAGVQNWMNVSDADFFSRAKEELAINIEAPLHLTSMFVTLPHLRTVMNVTSGLSFSPFARVPVYSATKAFFRSFTLSLRHLLKAKNIEVIEIIPPALNTDLGGKGLHDHAPSVSGFIDSIFEQLKEGKTELTYASSHDRLNASADDLRKHFTDMHQW